MMDEDEDKMEHDKKMNLAEENYEPATETEKAVNDAIIKKYFADLGKRSLVTMTAEQRTARARKAGSAKRKKKNK